MKQKENTTLIIILICSLIGLFFVSIINVNISLKKSMNIYSAALEDYKNKDYLKASKNKKAIEAFYANVDKYADNFFGGLTPDENFYN